MNTPLYIAKRYLLSKKSHNLINIITWISVVSVSVGAFALIVVLSVFNGFEELVESMVNKLAPDIQITAVKGKTICLDSIPLESIDGIGGVEHVFPCISEDALFKYNDKQHIGKVLGVPFDYQKVAKMNDGLLLNGKPMMLGSHSDNNAVAGFGVSWYLGINSYSNRLPMIQVFVPQHGTGSSFSLESGFNSGTINVSGIFSTKQDIDGQLVIVPFDWLASLSNYNNVCTEVEIFLKDGADVRSAKRQLKTLLGSDFNVFDQYEQQSTLYKMMATEKWVVYLILTLILIIATFNIIGSLSMLIIDKNKDVTLLKTFGADRLFIRKLFISEGMMISVVGGLIGLALGIVVTILQQQFGIIKMGSGNYIVDAYPIALHFGDVLLVLITILLIGGLSTIATVKQSMRKMKDVQLTAR